MRDQTLDDKQK